ncbi:MAG: hypothetical protein JW936_03650 [Sedimentisphaerales bacterium]|nr:hypothetical protein [Sedimentisphaerales bacterium]
MKKASLLMAVVLITLLGANLVQANQASDGDGLVITISPKTLYLGSEDTVVTVHSNIPYSTVNTLSLTLNDIPSTFTKADACGDLVVRFDRSDIKGIVVPGEATLTLSGLFKDGTAFSVSDTITVK